MADYKVTDTELTATANAIRAKTGDSAAIEWKADKGFTDAIGDISTGTLTMEITTAVGDQTTEIAFPVNAKPKFFGFEVWSGTSLLSTRYITGGTVEEITADGRYKIHSPIVYMQSTTGKLTYSEKVYGTYENGTLTLTTADIATATVFGRNITYRLYYVY